MSACNCVIGPVAAEASTKLLLVWLEGDRVHPPHLGMFAMGIPEFSSLKQESLERDPGNNYHVSAC